jgi:DNA polymerase III subunit delta
MKATLSEMTKALDNPPANVRFFLLYGADEASSLSLAKRIERTLGPDCERVDLDSGQLGEKPARLIDEACSFSLFGGKRYIRLSPVTEEALPAIEGLLDAEAVANPVVAVAGALRPSSGLLKIALARKDVLAHVSYPLDGEKADAVAIAIARECGLRLPSGLARTIVAAAGNDRAIIMQELEKLSLFLDAAPERPVEVTSDAIEAIGAAVNDSALSTLTEAVVGGRPDRVAIAIAQLGQDGVSVVPMLRSVQKRLALLAELRSEVEQGRTPSAVVEARGKAIFFREKTALTRDVSRWSAGQLATVSNRVLQTERTVKSASNAGDVVAEYELIRIALAAARLR